MVVKSKAEISVMLVEDDRTLRDIYSFGLRNRGYSLLTVVESREQVLKGMQQSPPSVIIMDTKLGNGPPGYEICNEIRRDYPNSIVIIGMSVDDHKQKWMENDADRFIPKGEFLGTIDQVIQEELMKKEIEIR